METEQRTEKDCSAVFVRVGRSLGAPLLPLWQPSLFSPRLLFAPVPSCHSLLHGKIHILALHVAIPAEPSDPLCSPSVLC